MAIVAIATVSSYKTRTPVRDAHHVTANRRLVLSIVSHPAADNIYYHRDDASLAESKNNDPDDLLIPK